MKITLIANTPNTHGLPSIKDDDGRFILIQLDYDYPGIASTFGWIIASVNPPEGYECRHLGTDGTIPCPDCKQSARVFIQAARQWIDDNGGAQTDDPGYFDK